MKAADATVKVLRETDNPAVMAGDSFLLHTIATEMGWPHDCWLTEKRVLDAIDRSNAGQLVKGISRSNRRRRIFYLPEHAPRKEPTP